MTAAGRPRAGTGRPRAGDELPPEAAAAVRAELAATAALPGAPDRVPYLVVAYLGTARAPQGPTPATQAVITELAQQAAASR